MYAEGKLPKPAKLDGVGPMWKPATIERWADREMVGDAAVEEATQKLGHGTPQHDHVDSMPVRIHRVLRRAHSAGSRVWSN
jgi:hypothetical protein